jgi:hypothetical protein
MEQEHWQSKCKFIISDFVDKLEEDLNKFFYQKFIISCPVFEPNEFHKAWIAIVYYKEPPNRQSINEALGLKLSDEQFKKEIIFAKKQEVQEKDKPTERQLRFLREHKFKIESDLTKEKATKMISDYLERIKQNNVKDKTRDYDY